MLQVLLLLLLGKLQDTVMTHWPAWRWALLFAILVFLFGLGAGVGGAGIAALLSGLYSWAYFALLRRVSDHLMMWLAIYLAGALLPLVLAFQMVK
ncbi:MAG: hypothetical protein KBG52_03820 [Neisseria sp.]|jgi:putative tricarboxylic transport membrane protein|nr:hypothetical protein [Neisseria sp.]